MKHSRYGNTGKRKLIPSSTASVAKIEEALMAVYLKKETVKRSNLIFIKKIIHREH